MKFPIKAIFYLNYLQVILINRSEHWVMVKGTARVQIGKDFHILHKNQSVYIPIGVLHRMENIGDELVEFVYWVKMI